MDLNPLKKLKLVLRPRKVDLTRLRFLTKGWKLIASIVSEDRFGAHAQCLAETSSPTLSRQKLKIWQGVTEITIQYDECCYSKLIFYQDII